MGEGLNREQTQDLIKAATGETLGAIKEGLSNIEKDIKEIKKNEVELFQSHTEILQEISSIKTTIKSLPKSPEVTEIKIKLQDLIDGLPAKLAEKANKGHHHGKSIAGIIAILTFLILLLTYLKAL